ncbi:MAG: hypothetical protein M1838_000799 [Thelocarpon superellum]|nr:MAG: hypothetical protein M1838_000799 [Thelocarpon superellum]
MALSDVPEGSALAEAPATQGQRQPAELPTQAAPPQTQGQPNPKTNGDAKAPGEASAGKISGAELKKKAKAEKQARRERERQTQEKQSGNHPGPGAKDGDGGPRPAGKGGQSKVSASQMKEEGKAQHKRANSVIADGPKPLVLRGAKPSQGSTASAGPKKEDKQVVLFGHLYGHSRRTSVSGVGKDVHPAVLALGLQMGNYVVCGSSARCVATLLVFKKVIECYTTPPGTTLTRHLPSHLSVQIDFLVSCRPLSVSMGNAIRWLKLEISTVDISTPDADAKTTLCSAIDDFIRERITLADQVIANSAGQKIRDGDVILTFAKSSIVQQTLIEAHARGVKFRVIVVDSRPLFEGKHLARALANLGVEVQYSLMHGVGQVIKDASKVFLGAHAMMSNGRLYSRVGTAVVAMVATEADVPVIVCCESVKFTEKVALDSVVTNEVAPPDEFLFLGASSPSSSSLSSWRETRNLQLLNLMYDVTPAEYIKMVITEYGSLPPSSVPVVHRLSTNS